MVEAGPPPLGGALAAGLPVLSVLARIPDFVFESALGNLFLDAPGGYSARVLLGLWRRPDRADVPVALKILVGQDPNANEDAAGDTGTEIFDQETRVWLLQSLFIVMLARLGVLRCFTGSSFG